MSVRLSMGVLYSIRVSIFNKMCLHSELFQVDVPVLKFRNSGNVH